ncbi:hypothetical protein GCM10007416_31470 [Kroppenstedtia guangzhouensis]|uniref:Putative regulatory protein FmdB zinc ribbon domain-containing protein n=1 Tax=Kroppenstedtia guangzhouensis TaxID=1274356 RepID=A0ABQ1H1W8_9BACL|nr:hypothetical protein [Kroppenstedtia guangzhouensis]GGA55983.1 hypothetical protein GCM10007416_31470 [Kroppenstedtia guangzhouensis]
MAKRYTSKEHIRKEQVLDLFECPECGFRFEASQTQNDDEGGWVCPHCESEELEVALDRLERIRDLLEIAEEGVDITGTLYMHLIEILEDNGPIDLVYDPAKMTPEQKEYAEGAVV